LRLLDDQCEGSERAFSFTLNSGELRLLQLASKTEKDAMIDVLVGNELCESGSIEIVQSERRRNIMPAPDQQTERRRHTGATPVIWQPLGDSRPGRVGWVAGSGGLISNLKVWENITLPLWYHAQRQAEETEQNILLWLNAFGLEPEFFAEFMAAPPYSIEPWQRKLAGLLRALVQMPRVLVVDAVLFEDIKARIARNWMMALETYAAQGRAVLVLADKATTLPWEKIE
jgi:ABC-type ATPase involved in cell division